MGIAALIIGIIALIFSFFPFVCYVGMFMALLSIIFGAVGIPSNHKGPAIAGLVLGIIAMIVSIIFGIAYCDMYFVTDELAETVDLLNDLSSYQ